MPSGPARAAKRSVARLVDETLAFWVTSPSSPGLSTRTVIAMLQPEHAAKSGPEPQFHCQFHTQLDADGAGTTASDWDGSSKQFQFQFQTHVDGGV